MSRASDRLERLLALVPYLLTHPGIEVEAAAHAFEVSQATLMDDLQLLFVCGLPGHLPDDLIEVTVESGRIFVSNADAIARPLRLRPDEALALLMGLKVLTSTPINPNGTNPSATSVAHTLMDKLTRAAGLNSSAAQPASAVEVVDDPHAQAVTFAITQAITSKVQLCIEYHSPRSERITMRHIDPLSVETAQGNYYVQAWCHEANELRVFRVDRIVAAFRSEKPRHVPDNAHPKRLPRSVFSSSCSDQEVLLVITEAARWMVDYYEAQVMDHLPQHRWRICVRTPDTEWLVRLVVRLGGDAAIVDPPELVEQVRIHARAALLIHQDA